MKKFSLYVNIVLRHARYGSLREAASYAWRHRRFWEGAESDGRPYVHIGHKADEDLPPAGDNDDDAPVCVLCGAPWEPPVKNLCECGGFCTWGKEKGGPPSSWDVHKNGSWTPKPVPKDLLQQPRNLE